MFIEIAVMSGLFWVLMQKKPEVIKSFRVVDAVRPTDTTPGQITFHWSPSKGAVSYTLQLYYLSTWVTSIEGLEITFDDNMAVLSYDSVETNQEGPNVIFNIRANAEDRKFFRETTKTEIRYQLLNAL